MRRRVSTTLARTRDQRHGCGRHDEDCRADEERDHREAPDAIDRLAEGEAEAGPRKASERWAVHVLQSVVTALVAERLASEWDEATA